MPRSCLTAFPKSSPTNIVAPTNSNVSLDYQFLQSVSPDWYLRDTEGNIIFESAWPAIVEMNISSYAPLVNGYNFITSEVNWLNTQIFPSGEWDGIFFDNLHGSINPYFPNYNNPALIDVDIERNGTRATPAQVSEMTRSGAISLLQQLRQTNGNRQLILANVGAPGLDAYVNGFLYECVNYRWNSAGTTNFSPMGWRAAFDAYRGYQATTQPPRTNSLEGCGPVYGGNISAEYFLPTPADIASHRFTMSTALLSDGFYGFDIHGNQSQPLWYDEYSVNSTGTAVQDLTAKGYLGQALSDATELASPATVLLQETFEGGTELPASLTAGAPSGTTVAISQDPGEVISGSGSLFLSNPNHTALGGVSVSTNPQVVQFTAGSSYLLTFDWRIIETVDTALGAAISTDPSQPLDVYTAPGTVAGDHGTAYLPFVIPSAGQWSIGIYVVNGGKVAIDNIQITLGGIGPWRRDFENGLVLVNPFNEPHTFSAADLAGSLNRTGIQRILGTQAPDVNNGQPVTSDLTLAAFDAIILLADHITANPPMLTISKTHVGSFTQGQQNATYQVTVSNAASTVTTSGMVMVMETVPSGLTLMSMMGTGWTCPGTLVDNCTRSDALAAAQSYPPITVTVNVAGNATSPQVNSVAVSGGGSLDANASDSTTILCLPGVPNLTSPANVAVDVSLTPTLSWSAASNATSYDVYFGAASNPPFVLNTAAGTSYMPGTLSSTTTYYWKIVAKNADGSTSSTIQSFTTLTPVLPSVSGVSPGSGSGMSQTFTFTFSDAAGWQSLGVQDILINSALDGRHACYIAYVPSGATTGSLYLVDDAGDAGGPYTGMVLPSSQRASNSQCTINGTGSSASGSGNTLTLTLAITFNSSFAGNKIFYMASADTGTGNSGWQTPAT